MFCRSTKQRRAARRRRAVYTASEARRAADEAALRRAQPEHTPVRSAGPAKVIPFHKPRRA